MIFLYVLLSIVLACVMYLLFAPICIEIDSVNCLYRIRFHKLFRISFFIGNNPLLMEMKIGFWTKQIDLSKTPPRKQEEPVRKKNKKRRSFSLKKLIGVIKSFKVRRLDATFDLGDMQWNGMLYPAFCWLSYKTGRNIYINFEGRNSIILRVENNIARMSRAYLCS